MRRRLPGPKSSVVRHGECFWCEMRVNPWGDPPTGGVWPNGDRTPPACQPCIDFIEAKIAKRKAER